MTHSPPPRLAALADVPELCSLLADAPRIAIDTEFHAERRWLPTLYLIQIGLPDGSVWVIDPLIDGLVAGLGQALREVPWVLHAGFQDIRLLCAALGGPPAEVFDTQIAAGFVDIDFPAPLTRLVSTWLQGDLAKTSTLSDWSKRPLTAAQLAYAAEDVHVLLPLWDELHRHAEDRGRSELLAAACREARGKAIEPPPPDVAWRQINAVPAMEPAALPVLQELASWRELQARERNQPTRAVLGDGVLVELARRRPASVEAVRGNRRMPRSISRNPEPMLELIGRAARRPEWGWPRAVRRGTPSWRTLSFLEVHSAVQAHDEGWAARLVAPRLLLEDVVLAAPADRAELEHLLGPWRDPLVGDGLWAACSGGEALQIRDGAVHRTPARP